MISVVLRENQSIKAAQARWAAARERVPQAKAWEDLKLNTQTRVERSVPMMPNTMMDSMAMLGQEIPMTGKNLSRGRTAAAEAQRAFEELRRVKLDAISRARSAYFRLANAYAQLEINKRNQELLKDFSETSRTKYEAGVATQTDVLLAQTDLARLSETGANIERDLVEQESLLNVLMNRPARAPLQRPDGLSFQPLTMSNAQIEAIALANRPEIISAERRIEAEKNRLQLANRQWFPDPMLNVQTQRYNGASEGISEVDVGVSIPLPFLNVSKYSAGVREAQKNLEDAEHQLGAARVEVLGLVRDQLKRIETLANNYKLYRDKIAPLARQSIESARASYESDKSDFLNLITVRRTLQDTESAMVQLLTDHQAAIADLNAMIGRSEVTEPEGSMPR